MATTHSLAITGCPADQVNQVETVILPDANALPGGTALAMRLGTPLLCKCPDGSLEYYVLDAERSTPSVPVLRPLTP